MHFTRHGLVFRYHGDTILRRWPWVRKGISKFHSSLYTRDFNDFHDYWKHIGLAESVVVRSPGRLQGYSWLEILTLWVRTLYPADHVVILTNVNASAKGVAFWSRLPKSKVENLLQDVVVLRCNDRAELFQLVEAVTSNFADSYGFSAGQFVISNTGNRR